MYWSIFMMMGYYKGMMYKRILLGIYALTCVGSARSSETENIYCPFPEIFTNAAQ